MIEALLNSLELQRSEDEVVAALVTATHALGFDYFGYAFVSNFPVDRPTIVLHNNYPDAWYGRRDRTRYIATDRGIRHGLRSKEPYLWSDHWTFVDADGGDAAGLKFGWTQSSVDGYGAIGVVTLSRSGALITPRELNEKEDRMRMLVRAGHSAMSRFMRAKAVSSVETLTAREIEVLQWSAAGKTCPEICELLEICASTVSFHLKNAVKKLGVRNKTAAVAHALVHGLLNEPINFNHL